MARSPLFNIYDPYDLLTQQAHLGMLPEDDEEMDVTGVLPVRRKPRISDLMPEEEQSSMLGRLAEMGSSGLSAIGYLLDTPGALVRGVLAGKPLSVLGSSDDRVTGRELLRQYGMIGDEDTWGNFGGSLAAEIALDPLTWVNPLAILGRGALTQSGKALKGAGLLRYAPEQAWQGYAADAAAQARGAVTRDAEQGARSYLRNLTPQQALAEIADPAERAAATARWQQQAARYGVDPNDLAQSAASLMDVRVPGTNIGFNTDVFGEGFGDAVAGGLDWLGEQSKRNPYTGPIVNTLNAGFRAPAGGTLDPDVQWDARLGKMDFDRAEEARMLLRSRTLREAMGADAGAVADAVRASGGTAPTIPPEMQRFQGSDVQRALVDYAESSGVPTAPGVFGPMPKSSGDDVADWVLENVPEFRSVRDLYTDSVQQARANAVASGLPDRDWVGESGTEFFPRQIKWWERILDPVRPNATARRERPWGRSQVLLDTADNFGRNRKAYTDIPGGQRTFRMLTGNAGPIDPATGLPVLDSAALQQSLIGADQVDARNLLDQAFDTLNVSRPFNNQVSDVMASPAYNAPGITAAQRQALLDPAIAERNARMDDLVNLLRGSDQQFAQNNTGIFDTPGWSNLMRYERGQSRVLANAGRITPRLAEAVQTTGPRGLADGMVSLGDAARTLGFDPENFGQMWLGRYGQDIANQSVPQQLVDSLRTVVRSTQPGDVDNQLLNAYDQYLNFWKVGALASPAFHTRNTYSGQLNAATMGAFNPLDWWAALRASMGNTNALARRLRRAPGFENLTDAERVARFQDLTGANRIGGGTIFDDISGLPEQEIRAPWLGAGNEGGPLSGFYRPGRSWADALNDFFTVRGVGITRNPAARNRNPFLVMNDAIGSASEDALRGGTFLNQIRKGVDSGEAADLVRLSQVDYSPQAFTSFERGLKRLLPFYSFQKGILPSIADNLLYRPGGLMGQSIRGVNRSTQPTEDNFVPEYLRQSAAIPLPEEFGSGNPELQRYLTNIDLPWESTFQLFTPGVGATLPSRISDTIQKTASNVLGMATPALKWPVEFATNRQLYTGRDLTDLYSVLERDMGSIGRPLEQAIVNLAPFGARGLGIYRQLTDDRLDPADRYSKAAFNLLAGVKATDVDQDRAKRQAARDMLNSILETTPGVRTYENITVPQDVLETMPRNQRDLYLLYKIIQSEAAKRARDKKKQQTALDPLELLGAIR
jgi:hypothetical protein